MKVRLAALVALAALPGTAAAQGVATIAPLYEMSKGWLIKSAEQMPDSTYFFKPTPAIRSFGQIIGHVANANYTFCSTARGEKSPQTQDFEKNTEPAALVKALKDAFAYCDPVYKMADASLSAPAEVFGIKMTRLGFAMLNVTHNNEHYGNLVTYFRLKGMTPPSSQQGM
jgi:uncharacterized damage-inducible protein DinB